MTTELKNHLNKISIRKLNDEQIVPIKVEKLNTEQIKGHQLFPMQHPNIAIIAQKHSGKTNVIFHILKKCLGRDEFGMKTRVYIFCGTHSLDANWAVIKAWLDKKNYPVELYDELVTAGEDNLYPIIESLGGSSSSGSSSDGKEESKHTYIFTNADLDTDCNPDCNSSNTSNKDKKKRPKQVASDAFFIFDDIGEDLKNSTLTSFLTRNRHYKATVVISTQYPNDLLPKARKNTNYMIVFGGHSDDKLQLIHQNACITCPFETFQAVYNHCVSTPYNFLTIDREMKDSPLRMNFSHRYMTDKLQKKMVLN